MSIRSKLNILVILAVVLALGPFAAYSLPWFSQSAQEEAKGDFRLIGALVVNVLQESYLSYISSQVELARNQKTVLREADLLISKLSADLNSLKPEEADRILDGQLAQFRRSGVFIFRLDPQGRPLGEGAPDSLGLLDWGTVRDITGQSLVEKMALGRVSPEGDFVIIESNDGSSADQITLLALLRPEPGGASFTVSLSSLEKARLQADLSAQNIVRQLSDRFHDVDLPPDASTVLMDRNRTVLASKGPVPDLDPLTPELLERAALEGPLEVEVEFSEATGPIIARIEHFSSLDWYLLLLVPRSVVTEPVKQMAHKLLIYAILGALVAYCLSSSAGRKLSDPISALARKANEASRLDFSSPEAADFFQSRPKARPKEEIGSLEASFDTMCRTIVTNVKALLAANKARERLDGELAAARNIQLGILPPPGEANPPEGLEVAYVLEPAKEVGGDLYDTFTASDGRLALIIGDVSGKGVPAALFMSMTVTLIRQALLDERLSPAETMNRVNRHLTHHNPSSMFVTLFIGLLEPSTLELKYANGGHCQPVVVGPKGLRLLLGASGPVVGALDDLDYTGFSDRLDDGETILLYTDGVTEAEDLDGNFFGLERLKEVSSLNAQKGPEILSQEVLSAVKCFRGEAPPSDDVALLAFGAANLTGKAKA